jgi:hypothetical protein
MAVAFTTWSEGMDKLEIKYEIVGLFDTVELVKSPNLTIIAGLTISIMLGPNVFSIENHKITGTIKLDGGAVAINGEWVHDLGYTPFLFPLELTESVTYAKLG